MSSSLATVLKPAGLDASKGLITALYMKEITDPQWKNDKGFQDWVAFMKKYYPDGALDDQVNAFGYTVAQAMTQVLKQCGNDLSRENIMKQAANLKNVELPLLLPGIKVNTSPTDHAPIEQEQLAKFDGERWVLFGELLRRRKEVAGRSSRGGGLRARPRAGSAPARTARRERTVSVSLPRGRVVGDGRRAGCRQHDQLDRTRGSRLLRAAWLVVAVRSANAAGDAAARDDDAPSGAAEAGAAAPGRQDEQQDERATHLGPAFRTVP